MNCDFSFFLFFFLSNNCLIFYDEKITRWSEKYIWYWIDKSWNFSCWVAGLKLLFEYLKCFFYSPWSCFWIANVFLLEKNFFEFVVFNNSFLLMIFDVHGNLIGLISKFAPIFYFFPNPFFTPFTLLKKKKKKCNVKGLKVQSISLQYNYRFHLDLWFFFFN